MSGMTRDELKAIGERMYPGRWQTALAQDIGVTVRQMQRYASGESAIPEPAARLIRILAEQSKT